MLGNDKCDDHLPGVLTEYADSAAKFSRCKEVGVFGINGINEGGVICIQVKIIIPERHIIIWTEEMKTLAYLGKLQKLSLIHILKSR